MQNYYPDAIEGKTVSGAGSSLMHTGALISELPILFERFNIQTLLDAPCGDLFWISCINFGSIFYHGVDIQERVIDRNIKKFPGKAFTCLDITEDTLPKADMIFSRDGLVHFSKMHIDATLQNFRDSGAEYLIMTHFTNQREFVDIETGDWRPINFCLPPFNMEPPVVILNERYKDPAFSDKSVALWRLR